MFDQLGLDKKLPPGHRSAPPSGTVSSETVDDDLSLPPVSREPPKPELPQTTRMGRWKRRFMERAERDALRLARDQARGYAVDYKRVTMAYAAETVIVLAMLYGSWLFALTYGHNDTRQISMMMLAPIGYAVIEYCRVPLALSVRSHNSAVVRTLAVIGVLCAAGVTVKSMSQLGEIMFRPRLFDVVHAQEKLHAAEDASAMVNGNIAQADVQVRSSTDRLAAEVQRSQDASKALGGLPEQKCLPIMGVDRNGQPYRSFRCSADPRIQALTENLKLTTDARARAASDLAAAQAQRARLDASATDAALSDARNAYREAVLNSQLHSFTGMVYGIAPTDVTDAQIHRFLRLFVFLPSIFVALASTLLAFTAIRKVEPALIPLDESAGQAVLTPYTTTIMEEAHRIAATTARDIAAREIALRTAKPVSSPHTA